MQTTEALESLVEFRDGVRYLVSVAVGARISFHLPGGKMNVMLCHKVKFLSFYQDNERNVNLSSREKISN